MSEEICQKYNEIADWFDEQRSFGSHMMEEGWLNAFVPSLPPGASILDLGCGTGEPLAGYFIRAGFRVTGVDGAPAMIEKCRKRFPEMEWIEGTIQDFQPTEQYDAVIAWDSTFHMNQDEQRAMFDLFAKATSRGAYLLFTSGPQAGEISGEMNGREFYYASLDPGEYRRLLNLHGFQMLRYVIEDETCGRHTVWLAKKIR